MTYDEARLIGANAVRTALLQATLDNSKTMKNPAVLVMMLSGALGETLTWLVAEADGLGGVLRGVIDAFCKDNHL